MTKSTKQSAAKTRQRRHSPPTLHIDECLGRGIAFRLQSEGHDARPFDEFAGRTDVAFLPIVGERHWVLVTKDKNIRRNQLEVSAILNAGVRAFVVTASGLNHQQISDLVSSAMPKITRICHQRGTVRFQHHRDRNHVSNLPEDARAPRETQARLIA